MDDILTPREKEVLKVAFDHDGDLNKTAGRLFLTRGTIRGYLHSSIFPKLMVNSLPGAFRVGLALKILDITDSILQHPPDLLKGREFCFEGANNAFSPQDQNQRRQGGETIQ